MNRALHMREHPEYKYRPRRKPKPLMGKKDGPPHVKYPGFPPSAAGFSPFFSPAMDPMLARSILSNPYHAAAAAACASALSGSLSNPDQDPIRYKPPFDLGRDFQAADGTSRRFTRSKRTSSEEQTIDVESNDKKDEATDFESEGKRSCTASISLEWSHKSIHFQIFKRLKLWMLEKASAWVIVHQVVRIQRQVRHQQPQSHQNRCHLPRQRRTWIC